MTGDEEQALAAKTARHMAKDGRTAAWLRGQPAAAEERDMSFWARVAAELDIIEARRRFRVLPGGASRHPLAVRIAAIADKHGGSAPALVIVPAGRQPRYRG